MSCVVLLFTVLLLVFSFKCLVANVCVCSQCVASVRVCSCMFVYVVDVCVVWLIVWYSMRLIHLLSRYMCIGVMCVVVLIVIVRGFVWLLVVFVC